jgi:predicted tellurium resistance membrane protein TerC
MLEIVLGIDNVIFLSIIVDKLPPSQKEKARKIGLILAMLMRLVLLMCISWIMGLKESLFTLMSYDISGRDLILILGGIFLILKSSHEIYKTVELHAEHDTGKAASSFGMALIQIVIIDIVFSLDSVITAVGMVDEITIMMVAVIISVGVMFFSAKAIGDFVVNHPAIKTLALAFLILIGVVLVGEGFDYHIPKGLIYGGMAISITMALLDMRRHKNENKNITKQIKVCPTCGK